MLSQREKAIETLTFIKGFCTKMKITDQSTFQYLVNVIRNESFPDITELDMLIIVKDIKLHRDTIDEAIHKEMENLKQ
jgi:hypothetical protein